MNRHAQYVRTKEVADEPDAIGRVVTVFRNGWLILAVTVITAAFGVAYALRGAPVYEGSTAILIKRNPALVADLGPDGYAATEVEVLRSRSVLQPVVERLGLDVTLDPAPPSLGAAVRAALANDPPGGRAGPSSSAAQPVRFDVPQPLAGQPFVLSMGAGDDFTLTDEAHGIAIAGRAGARAAAPSHYGEVAIQLARGALPPHSSYVVRRGSVSQAVERLQRALVVVENAKQSNVIKVTLQGTDPQAISRILGAVVAEYGRQREQEQTAEANRLLASYDAQLAASRAELRVVDQEYARVLQRSGIVDPEAESQSLVQQASALELQLVEAQQRRAELSGRVGAGHPAMEAADLQIAGLARGLGRNTARREALTTAGRELADTGRDRQALRESSMALLNQRSKLLAMVAARQEAVRLLDPPATPLRALTPNLKTMALLSVLGGLCLGLLASIAKNALVQRKQSRLLRLRASRFKLIGLARADAIRPS